jgi:hypothetical protein
VENLRRKVTSRQSDHALRRKLDDAQIWQFALHAEVSPRSEWIIGSSDEAGAEFNKARAG